MNFLRRSILATLALACLAACVTGRTAPPSLAGEWGFRIETGGGRVTNGWLSLTPAGSGYAGRLTTDRGNNVLPVRSFTVDGAAVRMHVESPQGAVTFAGALAEGARAFAGTLTYHDGRRFTLRATRL
jgi:hypothetical protein